MGSEICQSGNTEANELPDQLNIKAKQNLQMSTALPHENGSSHNDLFRSDLNKEEEDNLQEKKENDRPEGECEASKTVMHSVARLNPVRYQKMQVIRLNQKRKRINQFQVNAPFRVILLTIGSGLKHTIHEVGHDLFQKYYRQQGTDGWKLHKNGYYINYLAKKLTAILTDDLYFEGELVEDDSNRITPKARGLLLNEHGRYEGSFELGKAHGKGIFEDRLKKAVYKGLWENGKLADGVIQSTQYRYKGQIQENMAHGNGEIYFKQTEVSYLGKFKKGQYYDKKAIYQTKDYIYQGCFINGKKNGEGTLVEKQRNYKKKNVKYRPPCQYEGQWNNDVYLNQKTREAIKQANNDPNNDQQKKSAFPVLQQVVFEEEDTVGQKSTDRKVGKALPDDELSQLKPKFVWVDIPKQQKKKKKKKKKVEGEEDEDEDEEGDEDSQVF